MNRCAVCDASGSRVILWGEVIRCRRADRAPGDFVHVCTGCVPWQHVFDALRARATMVIVDAMRAAYGLGGLEALYTWMSANIRRVGTVDISLAVARGVEFYTRRATR